MLRKLCAALAPSRDLRLAVVCFDLSASRVCHGGELHALSRFLASPAPKPGKTLNPKNEPKTPKPVADEMEEQQQQQQQRTTSSSSNNSNSNNNNNNKKLLQTQSPAV